MGEKIFNSKLVSVSRFVILLLVFVIPFVFSFAGMFSISTLRLGFFFSVMLIVMILWSVSRLKKDSFHFPKNLLSLSLILVLMSSLAASIFSENYFISIFGSAVSLYTFVGLLVLVISAFLISDLFKEKKNSYIFTLLIYVSLTLSLIFNLSFVLLNFLPDLGFFFSNSINTFGKWSDFGLVAAFVVLLSYINLEFFKKERLIRVISWIGLSISALTALIVSENIIWIIISVISIIYIVYKIVIMRQSKSSKINESIPYVPVFMLIISFVMILSGSLISNFSDKFLQIYFSETKPGIQGTLEVSIESLKAQPITGYGENLFERAWQENKPDSVIQSNFWGVDFTSGYSYLFSIPAKTGILGTLAWIFFAGVVIFNLFRLLFRKQDDDFENYLKINHSIAILFFGLVLLLHVPSSILIILTFIYLGLFIGSLQRNGIYNLEEISINKNPKVGFLYIFSIIVLIILSIYIAYMTVRQISSAMLIEKANYDLQIGETQNVGQNIANAAGIFTTDYQLRTLSEYYVFEMNNLLSSQDLENQTTADYFRALLSDAITSASAAQRFDGKDYVNYLTLASIYESLISFGVEGSYQQAMANFEIAKELNPKNPGILVDMARASFAAGEVDEAKRLINESLQIKPRFVNAIYLLSQIQIEQGEIPQAISSIETSIAIQPDNAELYFQLGVLRYNIDQFEGAVAAFERAVILRPLFSNAKYFLGLSYDQSGRTEDAIIQFEDLVTLNPENQEVKDVLNRLKSGVSAVEETVDDAEVEELPLEETSEE